MSSSYESINYALRPAKAVERKMLCDTFRCLRVFRDLSTYRYIGFGSTYFSDFQLFHLTLGFRDMFSIERDASKSSRFDFNKPYDCIKMHYTDAKDALPTLLIKDLPAVLWLDYEDPLDQEILADIRMVASSITPSSALVVSVNAHPYSTKDRIGEGGEPEKTRLARLKEAVDPSRVPADIEEKDLGGWNFARTIRRIVQNEIEEALAIRNGVRPASGQLVYEQVLNFNYSDGAKICTIGGIFYDVGLEATMAGSGLRQLPFYRPKEDPYLIDIPSLTYRELRYLDTRFPAGSITPAQMFSIPAADIQRYRNIYRYFPHFSEVTS